MTQDEPRRPLAVSTYPIEVRVLDDRSSVAWDNFVENHHNGTPFHLDAWLNLCQQHQGARLVRLGFFVGDQLVGVCPFLIKRFFILKVAASPLVVQASPYMGPLCRDSSFFPSIMQALDRYLRKQKVNFERIIFRTQQTENIINELGYVSIERFTHVIDLSQGFDAIWKHMESSARRNIRKAEKSGVSVMLADPENFCGTYYNIAKSLYKGKNKIVPNSEQFYQDLLMGNVSKHVKLVIATVNGAAVSGAIMVHYKDYVYYLDGVNDRRYSTLNGSAAVQFFMIRWALDNGYKYYDFVGSTLQYLGRFKGKFGGNVVAQTCIERASPSWVFAVRQAYGIKFKYLWHKIKARLGDGGYS